MIDLLQLSTANAVALRGLRVLVAHQRLELMEGVAVRGHEVLVAHPAHDLGPRDLGDVEADAFGHLGQLMPLAELSGPSRATYRPLQLNC